MEWIPPMEPISTKSLIEGEKWVHEIKWDGIRGLTYVENDLLRIYTKKGRERTSFYPELHKVKAMLKGSSAVLDGEMVVLGEDSKPTFQLSLIRERVSSLSKLSHYGGKYPVVYVVFDIMYLDGISLTGLPFDERKTILKKALLADENIIIADDYSDGSGLFTLMKNKNWEGIVSKRLDSLYLPAKNHKSWFKIKTMKKLLAAVCGIQLKDNFPNSLILGIHNEGQWIFIGKASIGLTQEDLRNLNDHASPLKQDKNPFGLPDKLFKEPAVWLKPAITCWISFLEWTSDGVLRHPKILGFSNEKAEEADGREYASDE